MKLTDAERFECIVALRMNVTAMLAGREFRHGETRAAMRQQIRTSISAIRKLRRMK